jgi:hypothetical protein
MHARELSVAALAAVLLRSPRARAQGVPADLTGTYEGTVSCKFNIASNGVTGSFKSDVGLRIRYRSRRAQTDGVAVVLTSLEFDVDYSGRTIDTGTGKDS